jgi:L-ascorbate metabolism protein UlaG (beta-lactamase superfamily)
MFDIDYKGGTSVVITTKKSTLVFDPKLSLVGLKDIVIKDAIEVASESRFASNNKEARINIEGPGEYEVGDFSISGVSTTRHIDDSKDELAGTIYRVEIGDIRIALLGNIDPKLSEDQLEAIGVVDVLILPVGGGGYTLDGTSAASVVRSINPKVVIPTHYADDELVYEVSQDTVEIFNKELGVSVEQVSRFKVKNTTALPDNLTIIQVARS